MYKQVKLVQAILVIIFKNKEQNMGNHQNAECETSCSSVRHLELRNPQEKNEANCWDRQSLI